MEEIPTVTRTSTEESTRTVDQSSSGETATTTRDAPTVTEERRTPAASGWTQGDRVIEGSYADPDVVPLGDSRYRMYYAPEPEHPEFDGQVYSAVSTDGRNWTVEDGTRKRGTAFPDVVQLPDGRWRMYFEGGGRVKSAISDDGLVWEDEPGTRLGPGGHAGLSDERVASTGTVVRDDGTFLTTYRVEADVGECSHAPDPLAMLIYWATSEDGLNFDKRGIAIDARGDRLCDMADGPDTVIWDDGSIRLFFWSHEGVYESVLEDGAFSAPTLVFSLPTEDDPETEPKIPGDPTVTRIGDTWYMYYGIHKAGLYYATYNG